MKYLREFGLREGALDEYRCRHEEIWPEMLEMMRLAGFRNYTIWNAGARLIEYFECDDLSAAEKVIASSPVKARWDHYMADILLFDDSGGSRPYQCVFSFDSTERSL